MYNGSRAAYAQALQDSETRELPAQALKMLVDDAMNAGQPAEPPQRPYSPETAITASRILSRM